MVIELVCFHKSVSIEDLEACSVVFLVKQALAWCSYLKPSQILPGGFYFWGEDISLISLRSTLRRT